MGYMNTVHMRVECKECSGSGHVIIGPSKAMCPQCEGARYQGKWITLDALVQVIKEAINED